MSLMPLMHVKRIQDTKERISFWGCGSIRDADFVVVVIVVVVVVDVVVFVVAAAVLVAVAVVVDLQFS